MFMWGKLVATLSCLALMEGFFRSLVNNTSSGVGSDTLHNPVPWCLSSCLSLQYFCSQAVGFEFWTLCHLPALLTRNPPSVGRVMRKEWLSVLYKLHCSKFSAVFGLLLYTVAVIIHCISQHKWKSSYTKSDQVYRRPFQASSAV